MYVAILKFEKVRPSINGLAVAEFSMRASFKNKLLECTLVFLSDDLTEEIKRFNYHAYSYSSGDIERKLCINILNQLKKGQVALNEFIPDVSLG